MTALPEPEPEFDPEAWQRHLDELKRSIPDHALRPLTDAMRIFPTDAPVMSVKDWPRPAAGFSTYDPNIGDFAGVDTWDAEHGFRSFAAGGIVTSAVKAFSAPAAWATRDRIRARRRRTRRGRK